MEDPAGISFFDAHCHLQDPRVRADLSGVLLRARNAGVTAMSCCGSCESDWPEVKRLAQSNGAVLPSFGLHPWYVGERTGEWADALAALLKETPGAGVGEIGLDHALDASTFGDQESAFSRQLAIAAEYCRPVTIHCRRAFGRLIELIRLSGGILQGGIVHSYSGPPDLVKTLERFGLSISFSGSITFSGSKRARASVAAVSPGRLCLETDSPDIVPHGCAAPVNEPANITAVARAAAELLGVTVRDVAELTYRNASRVFGGRPQNV